MKQGVTQETLFEYFTLKNKFEIKTLLFLCISLNKVSVFLKMYSPLQCRWLRIPSAILMNNKFRNERLPAKVFHQRIQR